MMKKILYTILAAFVMTFSSCEKDNKWIGNLPLGVNTTRVNLPEISEGEFYFTVFASQQWECAVIQGGDWLYCDTTSGDGTDELHFTYKENQETSARIGKFELASSSKKIIVSVVQSGVSQTASSVDDIEL